jgi:hypothetical protein
MDASRARLRYIRANPAVAITIFDVDDMYRSATLFGRVVKLYDDVGLADIDSVSQHYLGTPYPDHSQPRVTALVQVERWAFWDSYRETPGVDEARASS